MGYLILIAIALVLIGLAIYVYYLLMKWMIISLAPDLLVILSLIGTILVPVLYAKSIFRVFGIPPAKSGGGFKNKVFQQGWRSIAWLPVFALLFLIYCDFAYCLLMYFGNAMSRTWSISLIMPFISKVVLKAWGNSFIIQLFSEVEWLRWSSSHYLVVLISAAIKSALIVPILIFIRGLFSTVEYGKQPAKVQYFFSQALQDLKNMIVWTAKDLYELFIRKLGVEFLRIQDWNWKTAGWILAFTWPIALTFLVSLILIFVVAAVMLSVMILLHALGVFVTWLSNLYISVTLFCIERMVILVRSGYAKCPYAGCHEKVPLPVFVCPNCGARHDRLIPGRYGVFRRTCTCGSKVPTLFWFGKGKLTKLCPHCQQPLPVELFGGNVHIPIYGGPSSGKTMFMMANTWQMLEGQLPEVKATLIHESDTQNYQDAWKTDFEQGICREKTEERLPDAFLLCLQRQNGLPISAYLYDPAGEALVDSDALRGHRFLRYFDGLALLLDPLSLPSMAEKYQEQISTELPATTSTAEPQDMMNRIVNALEELSRLSRKRRFRRRIAVVLTKTDMPLVQEELGIRLSDATPHEEWSELGADESENIRSWLSRHQPELLQLIETRFSDVRFFVASSLGHEPEEGKAFKPKQVLNPICWLLSKRRALSRPRLALWGARLAEGLAVLGVIASILLIVAAVLTLLILLC